MQNSENLGKLSEDKINFIFDLYENWSALEMGTLTEEYNLYSDLRNIDNQKDEKINIFCNDIEDLNVILYFNPKNNNYFVSLKNKSGLIYVFDNKIKGFSVLKDQELIQDNMSFSNCVNKEKQEILVEIKEELAIYNDIIKNLSSKFKLTNTIEKSTALMVIEEKEEELEEVNLNEEEFKIENIDRKEPTINSINSEINELKSAEAEAEAEVFVEKKELKFSEKLKLLTGISVLDNSHESFSKQDMFALNLEYNNNEKVFEQVVLSIILNTNDFVVNTNKFEVLNNFFKIKKYQPDNEIYLFIKENFTSKEEEIIKSISKENEQALIKFNQNLNNNVIINQIEEEENSYIYKAFNYNGDEFIVVEGNEILTSDFFVSFEKLSKGLEDKKYFEKEKVIGGNVFFKKIGKKSPKNYHKFVGLKNEGITPIYSVDLNKKENILSEKHSYVFNNIKDFLMGYLSNEDLHYEKDNKNEIQKTQQEGIELLFRMKDFYLEDVSELSKLEDSWSDKRKLKKIKGFLSGIRNKLTNYK